MGSSIALAIPAYNEASGLPGFLEEIDDAFRDWNGEVTFVVADDRSTDGTTEVVERMRPKLDAGLRLVTMVENSGHGAAVLRAYREALSTEADLVLQIDGDGQFDGRDIRRLAHDLRSSGADVAVGIRRQRRDPWFRKVLTRALRLFLRQRAGLRVLDPNCPLRAYRSPVLGALLEHVPPGSAVPNVYLAVLADRARLSTVELVVEHRERRGGTAQGTMWGKRQRKIAIPKRLIIFVWRSLKECRTFLRELDEGGLASSVARTRGDATGKRSPM